jgi:hypothetical protein
MTNQSDGDDYLRRLSSSGQREEAGVYIPLYAEANGESIVAREWAVST